MLIAGAEPGGPPAVPPRRPAASSNTPLPDAPLIDAPLPGFGDGEVEVLLAPLAEATGIVLAVSGGPDSLALLLLALRWRALASCPPLTVASVDHALRPESAAEVAAVASLCARFGIAHRALRWEGDKPTSRLHEIARAARYRLLEAAAIDLGASHIATAHHADDQAETVLIRLARGTGISGLAAMRPASQLPSGLTLARPLLALPKTRLSALVADAGLEAVDDPSNRDPRYARGALRAATAAQAALGLTPARLALLARRAARAEAALERATAQAAARCRVPNAVQDASIVLFAPVFFAEPEEIRLRLLRLAIETVAGLSAGAQELRLERLEDVGEALADWPNRRLPLKRTLGGTVLEVMRDGYLSVRREGTRRRGRKPPD